MKKKCINYYLCCLSCICFWTSQSQTLNFPIDAAIDDEITSVITETIMNGGNEFILTIALDGQEELDDLGAGDKIFFAGTNTTNPHIISITKDGASTNFTLNSIDYDAISGGGTIAITNQSGAVINPATPYGDGAGTISPVNSMSATNISAFNLVPTIATDLNRVAFHNINVTLVAPNTAPTATAPSAPMVVEDGMDVALADDIEVTDTDSDDQTVSFTVTGGMLTIGATGITFGGGGNGSASFTAAGTLAAINIALDAATFTPTAGLNGTGAGTISFTTDDSTDTSSAASVSFDITPVNDEPSFTVGTNQAQAINAGAQTVTGFITMIDDGDEETTQTISFAVTNDNNALFSAQPSIDALGNLTYTPATDATGTATVSVTIMDDGGIDDGGDDTSTAQTFAIIIVANPVITAITTDSGASAVDYVTNDNRPSVSGTAYPGSTISVILGGNDSFDAGITTMADAMSGAFTLDYPLTIGGFPVSDLSEGANNFQVVSRTNGLILNSDVVAGTVDTTNPSFTSITTADFTENGTGMVYTAAATDATTLTYNISGGVDAMDFDIEASSGVITFVATPDFETPTNENNDNMYIIDVTATDLAGNTSVATVTITVIDQDEIAPSVVISSTESNPTQAVSIPVEVVFSEAVVGFEEEDLAVINGIISGFTGSGAIYSFAIAPVADGAVTVDITANIADDDAGNGNEAATQFSITYESPTLNIGNVTKDDKMFTIFPNPIANQFTVSNSTGQTIETIEVYNVVGALVATTKKSETIDVSGLSAGAYFAIISTDKAKVSKPLIKQ